jgi:cell division protein FtsB
MGFKLAMIMFVIMGVVGGIGYWYYQDTQNKLAILHENNAKLEQAAATQTAAIKAMEEDIAAATEVQKKTEEEFKVAREQVANLQDKFNKTSALLGKRDIGTLGVTKPKIISRIITKGAKNINRCFEIVSGQPLTEKETNANKPSQLNSSCPTVANPNRLTGVQ